MAKVKSKDHHGVTETPEEVTETPIAEEVTETPEEVTETEPEPEVIAPERIWSAAEIAAAEAVHKVSTR